MVAATNTQVKIVAVGRINGTHSELRTDPAFAPTLTPIDHDPALATPFQIGVMDAEDNEPFAPEMYYIKAQHTLEYSYGFLSIRPDCEPAIFMVEMLEAAYMAQLADERDEQYDAVNAWQS